MNKMFDARFNGNRQPVWQSLGTTFVTNVTATDGLREIGGDFQMFKAPLRAIVQEDGRKQLVTLPGRYDIMRKMPDGSYRSFGSCRESYEIIQRADFTAAIDDLTVRWPLENMGMLEDGKTLYCMLNAGTVEIKGDPMTAYFMIVDVADGGTAAKAVFTGLRMRCWNMLQSSLRASVVNVSLQHRRNIQRDLHFAIDLTKKMAESQANTLEYFQYMADGILTAQQAARVFEVTYPMPKRSPKMEIPSLIDEDNEALADIRVDGLSAIYAYEYYMDKTKQMRAAAAELLQRFNDEQPMLANTGYAVYNVAVEMADWREGPESANVDAMFGRRANEKKHAFVAVLQELD